MEARPRCRPDDAAQEAVAALSSSAFRPPCACLLHAHCSAARRGTLLPFAERPSLNERALVPKSVQTAVTRPSFSSAPVSQFCARCPPFVHPRPVGCLVKRSPSGNPSVLSAPSRSRSIPTSSSEVTRSPSIYLAVSPHASLLAACGLRSYILCHTMPYIQCLPLQPHAGENKPVAKRSAAR